MRRILDASARGKHPRPKLTWTLRPVGRAPLLPRRQDPLHRRRHQQNPQKRHRSPARVNKVVAHGSLIVSDVLIRPGAEAG